jgi:teichuronic acid biosynthesis glycosyltransferase TuaC
MKVLFVSSGNSQFGISPIVKRQGDSLLSYGIDVHYFRIVGKGLIGYLSNLKALKSLIRKINPEIVHAHYSLSAFLTTLARPNHLVVSLMGSDVKSTGISKLIIKIFSKYSWDHTIVKSIDMKKTLGLRNPSVIPNGIDINAFFSLSKTECRIILDWCQSAKHVLFAASPSRPVKNFDLAKKSFNLLKLTTEDLILHTLENVPPKEVPIWLNAADLILLTSLWEGSPNIIKEAMTCNCPIVATDVGDVSLLFGKEPGHYLTSFDPEDVAKKLKMALDFSEYAGRTNGRERIMNLKLDSDSIAHRIIEVYSHVKNT